MTPSFRRCSSSSFQYTRLYYSLIFEGAIAADVCGRPMAAEIKEDVSSGIYGGARWLVSRMGTYILLYVAIVDLCWAMR